MVAAMVLARAGFDSPDAGDFVFRGIGGSFVNKPFVLLVLSILLIVGFFWVASRRMTLVPGKLQFAAESLYNVGRNSIGRDVIGSENFRRYVPHLSALFCFVLINNLFAIIPFLQFPTFSRIGYPAALAIITWVVFVGLGVRRHGLGGYLRGIAFPPGVPKPIYLLLAPIELLSTIIVRPLTLALRLFANMFAGHLILLVFILGGSYMLGGGPLPAVLSPFAFILAIVLTFFEALVEVLQAYIFTLLTALYIAGSLADEH